jgi:hypothetical protein
MGSSPKDCALLSGNGNTLKLEMTTKLKDKQTSIATVRDLLQTFATFPAPLLSHCRLFRLFGACEHGIGAGGEIYLCYRKANALR